MLFNFLKYVQPTNYFGLFNKEGKSIFPMVEELPKEIRAQLEEDVLFKSEQSIQYDLSWQAIQKGYIGDLDTYEKCTVLPLQDEYRFIRKYFNPIWATYVLLFRLLSFKNPFKELQAWWATRKTERSNFLGNPIKYQKWETFDSSLLIEKPLVTIVIPTLNRYKYLKDVLEDLEKQEYENFDVIVVDQSEPFQKSFYDTFKLNLKVIYQKEKALWLARNTAIKTSNSDYLLLFDDDSRVKEDWITNHLKCIDFFNAEVSSGVSISTVGAKVPGNYSFFRVSDQIDTGNVLIKKEVFKAIGLFDRQFEKQRMGDGEFGLRSHLHGFLNISNPHAERLHLKVATGGLRQMGSWDGFRPKKWLSPRPIPSVLYLFRKYYGTKRSLLMLLKTIPPSIMPYRFKRNRIMMLVGAVLSIFIFPMILLQVFISWRLASKKLQEGEIIEKLVDKSKE